MATIKDVAKMAGVSTTTVSHVMNKTRFVAEKTEQQVLAAIKALNYSPSAVARSLKINTTKSIGMLVTDSQTPYFAEVIQAVEESCYRQGYSLFLCSTRNDPEKIKNYLTMLSQKRVDGLIVLYSEYQQNTLDLLEQVLDIPMIVLDWGAETSKNDILQDNSIEGARLATQYFIDNGHKDIGIITGDLEKRLSIDRLNSFKNTLEKNQIPLREEWIIPGFFNPEDGYEAMNQLLDLEKRPTAVFCCNDMMALGAMAAITERGLNVPQDISVIGYDDIHASRFFSPPLTTVNQPKRPLGEQAVIRLFERINNKDYQPQPIILHPELIERLSVRDLNQ